VQVDAISELAIPAGATVVRANGVCDKKLRTDEYEMLSIEQTSFSRWFGPKSNDFFKCYSGYQNRFTYKVGTVYKEKVDTKLG